MDPRDESIGEMMLQPSDMKSDLQPGEAVTKAGHLAKVAEEGSVSVIRVAQERS